MIEGGRALALRLRLAARCVCVKLLLLLCTQAMNPCNIRYY